MFLLEKLAADSQDQNETTERTVTYRRLAADPSQEAEICVVTESELNAEDCPITDRNLHFALERAIKHNSGHHKWLMDVVANHDDTLSIIYFPHNKDYGQAPGE